MKILKKTKLKILLYFYKKKLLVEEIDNLREQIKVYVQLKHELELQERIYLQVIAGYKEAAE